MSEPLQPIHYMQQRDLTPSEWWEFYQQKKTELEASVRECELEIKDLTIRAQKAEKERDEARQAFATATNHAIEAREMLRRIMDWSPCLPDYEPDAQHLKWQSDAYAARKFLEAAK